VFAEEFGFTGTYDLRDIGVGGNQGAPIGSWPWVAMILMLGQSLLCGVIRAFATGLPLIGLWRVSVGSLRAADSRGARKH